MGLFNFPQVDSNVNVTFCVDGDEYEVEQFKIGFHQPVDGNKNQPEGEVRGGRIMITLSQTTGTSGVIFEVVFSNAYCIKFHRSIDAIGSGLSTTLIISSEKLMLNGIEFDNFWVK